MSNFIVKRERERVGGKEKGKDGAIFVFVEATLLKAEAFIDKSVKAQAEALPRQRTDPPVRSVISSAI